MRIETLPNILNTLVHFVQWRAFPFFQDISNIVYIFTFSVMRDSVTLKIFLSSVFYQCYGMTLNIFYHQSLEVTKVYKDNSTKRKRRYYAELY